MPFDPVTRRFTPAVGDRATVRSRDEQVVFTVIEVDRNGRRVRIERALPDGRTEELFANRTERSGWFVSGGARLRTVSFGA